MNRALVIASLLVPFTAHAQQPAPPALEAQALGITAWIAQATQEIGNLKAQNATLQAENAQLKAAAAKPAPTPDPPAKIVPVPVTPESPKP
jgi:hypothetical protein